MDTTDRGDSLAARFERQRSAFAADRFPDAAARRDRLARLAQVLGESADGLAAAIAADFGHRSPDETRLLEIFPSREAIAHARRHVGRWMRPERRPTSRWFLPGRSQVVPQPRGVIGIVVPWNYPVFLAMSPLAAALAAGNRAMLKPSEQLPRTTDALAQALARRFPADEVDVVAGDLQTARAFTALPFDHILFTGSGRVGREVMRAAAEHLTPVTLELGGKSPAIVAPGYPIEHAAERIVVGKCMNAGQTCIAPDYALVPEASLDAFVAAARDWAGRLYPAVFTTPDYSSIVSDAQFDRLAAMLDEAVAGGARAIPLAAGAAAPDRALRRFPPIALTGVPATARVLREEIFGPLLPVVPYRTIDEAIGYVNARPHPLALYLFDRDAARTSRILRETAAGGVTVNDTILHIAQEDLPFGGVGASGMGAYHGRDGFLALSHRKAVFRQSRWNAMGLFRPPYGARFRSLVRLLTGGGR